MTALTVFTPGALGDRAASAGGAAPEQIRRCRGCQPILTAVSAVCLAVSLALSPMARAADVSVSLPSGLEALAWDRIDEAPLYRVRYLAPGLAETAVSYDDLAADMAWLCAEDALPGLLAEGLEPARVVVTLMAEPVEFGVRTPGVAQYFESYAIEESRCIWEAF